MYDFAKAGEVDVDRIIGEKGTTKDFFDKWNIDIPMEVLARIGSGNNTDDVKYPSKKNGKVEEKTGKVDQMDNVRMVNLFFTKDQHEKFLKMEEKLAKKFKTDNVTDTVFAGMKLLAK